MDTAARLESGEAVGPTAAMIRLARPRQWIKNALVGAALVFSQRLFDPRDVLLTVVAFIAFCALSSAGYVLNDIVDREADRLNPEKSDRPLARGDLTVAAALMLALVLAAMAALFSNALGWRFPGIALLYPALDFPYSFSANHHGVMDLISLA